MTQTDIEKLQKLLEIKKLEQPSEFYFESVVSSFHRRIDAHQAEAGWLNKIIGIFDFSPRMQTVYATGIACIIAIGIFTAQNVDHRKNTSKTPLLASQKANFVNDSTDQLYKAQNADNIRELILASNVMADADPVKTSYVLDVQPVSYENGLSF